MKIKWIAYSIFFISLCWGMRYMVGGLSYLVHVTPTEYLFRMIAARDFYNVQLALEYDKRLANARNINGTPALIEALVMGNPDIVNRLVQAGGDPNVTDPQGNTPLMTAVQMNNPAMVRLLLNYGADPKLTTSAGMTPLLSAITSNQLDMIAALLEREGGLNVQDHEGRTPLMYAIERGNQEAVRMLVSKGINEALYDKSGKTALMYAATSKPALLADILASPAAKPMINYVDKNGRSALLYAMAAKAFEQARMIVEHGGNPFIVSNTGDTIFSLGDLYRAHASDGGTDFIAFLMDYARRNYGALGEELIARSPDIVEQRLQASPPGTINKPVIEGLSPLHIAVIMNNIPMVDMLLRNKAELNQPDAIGRTPLMQAALQGDVTLVERLLQEKGVSMPNPMLEDKGGDSALTIAQNLIQHGTLSPERRQQQERVYEILHGYHAKNPQ